MFSIMFCRILGLIISFILFLVLVAYCIFLIIFRAQDPKFYITNASLTQFNFNTTTTNNANTLHYNLALNLAIRNPNKMVGIHYRDIQVIANYRKKSFAKVNLINPTTPFYQGHKNTTFLNNVVLQGQQVVKFGKREISQLNKEAAAGVYSIDVRLGLRIAANYGKLKTWYFSGKFNCKLKVPLTTTSSSSSLNETSATLTGFKTTKCRFVSHYRHHNLLPDQ